MAPTIQTSMSPVRRPTATVRTAKGALLRLRPVEPDDRVLLEEGFERLSEKSRYLRFMAPTDHLSRTQLRYLSEIDYRNHFAWGALAPDGSPAAVGRFVRLRESPDAADVALTVLDEYQGRGVGKVLIQALAVVARRRGIAVLHFDVLPENEPMLGLLRSLGASLNREQGVVHGTIHTADIGPPEVLDGDLGRLADRLAMSL